MSYNIGHKIVFSKQPPFVRIVRTYEPGTRIVFPKQTASEAFTVNVRVLNNACA